MGFNSGFKGLIVITFVTIKCLGLADVGKNSNSFFSRFAWKPAIRTVELSAEGPGEKLTNNNTTSRVPSPISIPSMGFLTVATVRYHGAVCRGSRWTNDSFGCLSTGRCRTVSTCECASRYAGQSKVILRAVWLNAIRKLVTAFNYVHYVYGP